MLEKATFGAGCFWGVEEAFRVIPGVEKTCVGYMGGKTENPTYEQVCSDRTGHAEVLQVEFDPEKITFEALANFFWSVHNPTEYNRQGPDVGTQYRSAIFYHSEEQKLKARELKALLDQSGQFSKPIVTEITAAQTFYPAEDYHQRYFEKRGGGTCHI